MALICPKCGALQPDAPRCANCGFKFEVPIETSQGTLTTKGQLVDYALAILVLIIIVIIVFGAIVLWIIL